MPKLYYQTCPVLNIGTLEFKHSKLYTPVKGFKTTNEYSLLEENQESGMFAKSSPLDFIKKLPIWDQERQLLYNFNLYEKSYLKWSDKCFYIEKEKNRSVIVGKRIEITPKTLVPIIEQSGELVWTVEWLYIILSIYMYAQVFEFGMIFMHRNEAMSKETQDKIIYARRLLAIVLTIIVFLCYKSIYNWHGHEPIEVLAETQCSNDLVLQETFKTMRDYLDATQNSHIKTPFFVIMGIVVFINICSLVYKVAVADPTLGKDDDFNKVSNDPSDTKDA